MGYHTGTESNYANLATALKTACVADGWTLTADVLSKGAAYVQVTSREVRETISEGGSSVSAGAGIVIRGGTGYSGGALVNPSDIRPRLGPWHYSQHQPTPPFNYEIFTFTDPDEVYMIVEWGTGEYYFLAFGLSNAPGVAGTGLWLTATAGWLATAIYLDTTDNGFIIIGPASGGDEYKTPYNTNSSPAAPFWHTDQHFYATSPSGSQLLAIYGALNSTIHADFDGFTWFGCTRATVAAGYASLGFAAAVHAAAPHIARGLLPTGEAVLTPIKVFGTRISSKVSLLADLKYARYLRVDSYEPGETITLGSDTWKVYPFYKKDLSARDGGNKIAHTGTFGWAIKNSEA